MSYQLSHQYCDGIIEVAIEGQNDVIDLETGRCIASKVREVMHTHSESSLLLVDVRQLRGRLRVADTFWHVREYASRRLATRIAVIDRTENAELSEFHENAASNLGLALRYFAEPSEARLWLKTGESPG